MKVSDLIAKLRKYDQDLSVQIPTIEGYDTTVLDYDIRIDQVGNTVVIYDADRQWFVENEKEEWERNREDQLLEEKAAAADMATKKHDRGLTTYEQYCKELADIWSG